MTQWPNLLHCLVELIRPTTLGVYFVFPCIVIFWHYWTSYDYLPFIARKLSRKSQVYCSQFMFQLFNDLEHMSSWMGEYVILDECWYVTNCHVTALQVQCDIRSRCSSNKSHIMHVDGLTGWRSQHRFWRGFEATKLFLVNVIQSFANSVVVVSFRLFLTMICEIFCTNQHESRTLPCPCLSPFVSLNQLIIGSRYQAITVDFLFVIYYTCSSQIDHRMLFRLRLWKNYKVEYRGGLSSHCNGTHLFRTWDVSCRSVNDAWQPSANTYAFPLETDRIFDLDS